MIDMESQISDRIVAWITEREGTKPEELEMTFQDGKPYNEWNTVTVKAVDGVDRQNEYSVTTDIVPNQYLVIALDSTERAECEPVLQQTFQQF